MLNVHIKRFITGSILATTFWSIFFYLPPYAFSILLFGILLTILFFEWKNFFKLNNFWFWFITPWYPILPFILLIYMNQNPCYRILLYYLFLIVFSFDTSAYFTGLVLGFRKIIPSISPGKTVEGCIGGFLGAMVVFYFALLQDNIKIKPELFISFIFFTCVLAFLGDIFESFLKRNAHLKDSGHALPGHGGFLDRFDAVIMVTFFFFLFRNELVVFFCIA